MKRAGLVVLMLVLAACGEREPSGSAKSPPDPLRGHTFLSTAATTDGAAHELVAGTRVSLRFTDDGRLIASAGCNTMTGPVDTADGRLSASLAMTEVGCDQPRHTQDEWLSTLLGETPSWELAGPDLVLRAGGTELRLTDREVAEPDLPLVDTTWVVDTVIDGQSPDSASSSTPAGATAMLVFREDVVEVFGGCNSGTASYDLSGETITFNNLGMTLKACAGDGVMELERAVTQVLDGEITFEVESDHLTLTHPSGKGLRLHAE